MAANGEDNPRSSIDSIIGARSSLDSERNATGSPAPGAVNGSKVNGHTEDPDDEDLDPITRLQRELDRTREEKDTLATQYRNLLSKLNTMRTTLGNKLKQDAEELDRQDQLVQQLTAQNEDFSNTIETLKEELVASHEEAERASRELDSMRSRVLEENAQEATLREREVLELQTELERVKMEREEWERNALQERALGEDLRSSTDVLKRELDLERAARDQELLQLEEERIKVNNLQSVLQDFETTREREKRQTTKEYEDKIINTTQLLAEFKSRALSAEAELEESRSAVERARTFEKQVKEKDLLIGKLRHEAVIINEHLIEALRRLKRSSSDNNVDRRLVTNVVLSFLNTPRADSKRFEMLSLLASILSWSDSEREKAGLQRSAGTNSISPSGSAQTSSFWGRSMSTSSAGIGSAKSVDLEKTDETESFSRLWVEFLMTEAASGEAAPGESGQRNNSLPGTPTGGSHPTGLSPSGTLRGMRRLGSLGTQSGGAMASSPNLLLSMPPGARKGKEKEIS